MKLVHILSLACVLAAAGCSSTSDTGTDGGTGSDTGGGGDTGTGTDTGGGGDTTVQDTGTTGDTPADASACQTCVSAHCNTEVNACLADTTAHPKACSDGLACLQACTKGDTTCENACVSDFSSDTPFNDLVTCINTNCKSECL